MKKSIIAAALLSSMALAGVASAATDASQVFTWSGTVPATPISNGWVIAKPDGSAITNGALNFDVTKDGKAVLLNSQELRFNVFKSDDKTPAKNYSVKLEYLGVSNTSTGAQIAEQPNDGYFAIQALKSTGDVITLVKGTAVDALSGETVLSVVRSGVEKPSNQPNAGDGVIVQATILVENAA